MKNKPKCEDTWTATPPSCPRKHGGIRQDRQGSRQQWCCCPMPCWLSTPQRRLAPSLGLLLLPARGRWEPGQSRSPSEGQGIWGRTLSWAESLTWKTDSRTTCLRPPRQVPLLELDDHLWGESGQTCPWERKNGSGQSHPGGSPVPKSQDRHQHLLRPGQGGSRGDLRCGHQWRVLRPGPGGCRGSSPRHTRFQ